MDPLFLPASYGYRPNKPALDAVGAGAADVLGLRLGLRPGHPRLFDNLDHDLRMRGKSAEEGGAENPGRDWGLEAVTLYGAVPPRACPEDPSEASKMVQLLWALYAFSAPARREACRSIVGSLGLSEI